MAGLSELVARSFLKFQVEKNQLTGNVGKQLKFINCQKLLWIVHILHKKYADFSYLELSDNGQL